MKLNLILSAIGFATMLASCQNQQSKTESRDSMAMATDTGSHKMDMQAGDGMMAGMDKMMDAMHNMEKTGNVDHDLAASMKVHHQGAIDMARTELEKGSDAQLKAIAQKIVDAQGKEMSSLNELMDKYRGAAKNYDPANTESGLGKAMSVNMMSMMDMPKTEHPSIDHQFAMMMAKHHADGVEMGNAILKHATDPMFKTMTQKMINDQTAEIKDFEKWLSTQR